MWNTVHMRCTKKCENKHKFGVVYSFSERDAKIDTYMDLSRLER